MKARVVLYICALGIVSAAVDDWAARQALYSRSRQNVFLNSQPEVTVLPRKWGVYPSTTPKTFSTNSYVTSASASFSSANPIVVSDVPVKSALINDKVQSPAPENFSSYVTTSTTQSPVENSVQVITEKPVPVPVKIAGGDFIPIVSTPRPFVPSPTEKVPTSENEFKNPFVVKSSFRLWPKLPEPVPVPVLAPKSFTEKFNANSGAYVGPQYIKRPPLPSQNQPIPVPVQYPENPSQPQAQIGQTPNQGYYLVFPNGNNPTQYNSGNLNANSNQRPIPPPQSANPNIIILSAVGSQNPVPSQNQNSQYQNGYYSNQGYNVNQQSQQPNPNYAFLVSSQNSLSGQQTQQGQQSPLTYIIIGANGAASQPQTQQPQTQALDQQALKYALFGAASGGIPSNLGNQVPSSNPSQNGQVNAPSANNPAPLSFAMLGPQNYANSQPGQAPVTYTVFGTPNALGNQQNTNQLPQNYGYQVPQNQVAGQQNQPTLIAIQAPNAAANSPSYLPNTGYSPSQYPFSAQSPTQYYDPSGQPIYQQASSPQNFGAPSTPSSQQSPQYFIVSSTPSPAQSNYYQSPSPQYTGFSSTQNPSAQSIYYQSPQFASSTQSPADLQNYYQPTGSSQFGSSTGIPSAQQYYQSTPSPQFGSSNSAPASQQYYQSTSSPQFVSSTAAPQYYQSTPSPQFASSTSAPAAQQYYQSTSSSQFVSSTAAPQYYQSTPSPQFASSTSAPAAQQYYQSTSSPQFVSSTAAPQYYQSTASPQFASSTSAPAAQQYYQSTSSPQLVSSTASAAQQYYQSTASPQFASSTPAPAAQQYYQSTSSPDQVSSTVSAAQQYYQSTAPQYVSSTPAPVSQNYYQSSSSPLYASSTPATSAQPNLYQSQETQYSVPDAQNYYQSTTSPQNVQYSSTPSPSTPVSQVRFSSEAGSYSYFV